MFRGCCFIFDARESIGVHFWKVNAMVMGNVMQVQKSCRKEFLVLFMELSGVIPGFSRTFPWVELESSTKKVLDKSSK